MINSIILENFRSIVKKEITLGNITVLTGANNSGKSSVMYGLLALKNIAGNPNQSLDSCLTLHGSVNLGGFGQVVYSKDQDLQIKLGIRSQDNSKMDIISEYSAVLGKIQSEFILKCINPSSFEMKLPITFPYAANQKTGIDINSEYGIAKIIWNGISPTITFEKSVTADQNIGDNYLHELNKAFNNPLEDLRAVDFVTLRRGFTKPTYTSVAMQAQLINEDEFATLLATDRDLEGEVAHYLGKIVDRYFNVRATIGTGNFSLQTRDKDTGLTSDLVNEGFGTNQLVTILTKALKKDTKLICMEETEIHLHPSIMTKLVDVLIEISNEKKKQFIISTHSEHVIMTLLNRISKGNVNSEDIKIYYLKKEGKKSKIEEQEINNKGQVKGGLKAFFDSELGLIKSYLGVDSK